MINDEIDDNSNDDESVDENSNDESFDPKDDPDYNSDHVPKTVRGLKKWRSKQKEMKFQKLFEENRHRFDLTCDSCPKSFNSLDETRAHYLTDHNNTKGYIKCCRTKLQYRCQIVAHLNRHLEPEKYRLV